MGLLRVRIAGEFVEDGLAKGNVQEFVRVADGLPSDARLVVATMDHVEGRRLVLLFESASVPLGETRDLDVVITRPPVKDCMECGGAHQRLCGQTK